MQPESMLQRMAKNNFPVTTSNSFFEALRHPRDHKGWEKGACWRGKNGLGLNKRVLAECS